MADIINDPALTPEEGVPTPTDPTDGEATTAPTEPETPPFTQALPKDYWISPTAFHISFNAMSDRNKIQCSVQSGAVIMCYMRGVQGLEYDNGHNYQRWRLIASPTHFSDNDKRYIYVAIPKSSNVDNGIAQVVFPNREIDLYGVDHEGNQYGNTDYWYIFLQGIISASVINGVGTDRKWYHDEKDKEWIIDYGSLATDQAIAEKDGIWYKYDSITETVQFLKEVSTAIFQQLTIKTKLLINGILDFGGHVIRGIAETEYRDADGQFFPATSEDSTEHIVTPAYGKEMYVSRQHADTKQGDLTVIGRILNAMNADGSETYIGSESFAHNLLGHGWRAYFDGRIEADSLSLRKFLEVPELRYNRTTITAGVTWHTVGAGIIEDVTQGRYTYTDAETMSTRFAQGIIKLKLEDGEVGTIAYNDLAMGIWHNLGDSATTMNEAEDYDGHDGNFMFAGFQTIYFRIVALCHKDGVPVEYNADGSIKTHYDSDGNDITCTNAQYFLYELREKKDGDHGWQRAFHPVSGMHFACYANRTNAERQSCWYITTTYLIMLAGMTDWTYDSDSIQIILGQRSGFTIRIRRWDTGEEVYYPLKGMGAAFGNAVRWGSDTPIDRPRTVVSQQLEFVLSDMQWNVLQTLMQQTRSDDATLADQAKKVISDMGWQPITNHSDQYHLSADKPYLYQRWRILLDDGKYDEDKLYEIWKEDDYNDTKNYILQTDYAVINRIGWDGYILADGDGYYETTDAGVYNVMDGLSVRCFRYNGEKETTDGYLYYVIDDDYSNEREYTGDVPVRDVTSKVTFNWYNLPLGDPQKRLWRTQSVSVIEDAWTIEVTEGSVVNLPKNQTKTFHVRLMSGTKDITTLYDDTCFEWYRYSGDSAEDIEADRRWAERRKADLHSKHLTVMDEDVYKQAQFKCRFDDGRD